jgi:hypothetical protein
VLRLLDGLTINIKAALAPADDQVLISSTDALKLNAMAVGDHTYFALSDGRGTEVVKYTHNAAIVTPPGTVNIPVDRAQCASVRRAWPIKACMYPSLAECVLREFICQTTKECV